MDSPEPRLGIFQDVSRDTIILVSKMYPHQGHPRIFTSILDSLCDLGMVVAVLDNGDPSLIYNGTVFRLGKAAHYIIIVAKCEDKIDAL